MADKPCESGHAYFVISKAENQAGISVFMVCTRCGKSERVDIPKK